ncbi:MAG: CDP-diacylglycerol--glycerol-3-phosphate 3-phosphatidyltransferase [Legionella sp.]
MNTIPNYITLGRIVIIPVFILLYYLPYPTAHVFAAALFATACVSDWMDGYLARKMNSHSAFGSFLDPVADKLLVSIALILLLGTKENQLIVFPAIVIIARAIVVSALREWMSELGNRTNMAVKFVGKVKTFLQMIAITWLLISSDPENVWWVWTCVVLLYIAALMTLWSMLVYLNIVWPDLTQEVNDKANENVNVTINVNDDEMWAI